MAALARSLETPHLVLRPVDDGDTSTLCALLADPIVMRHFGSGPMARAEATRWLADYRALATAGEPAPWAIVSRETGQLVGWGGLYVDPHAPGWGLEVGYLLAREAWGKGLATELVAAAARTAFADASVALISAFARPENAASIRVLEKNAFRYLRYEPALERNHYELSRAAFDATRAGPAPAPR